MTYWNQVFEDFFRNKKADDVGNSRLNRSPEIVPFGSIGTLITKQVPSTMINDILTILSERKKDMKIS